MQRGTTGKFDVNNTTGETVRAFVPARLPPAPPLELTAPRQRLLERALLACGRLDGVSALLPDPDLFLYAYVRREAVLSSQIEGTQSSLSDLLLFEMEQAPGVPFDDVVEVSNYVAAMEHGLARLREGFPLSNRLIREIHGKLLAKGRGAKMSPGEFRRSQNWIGRPGCTLNDATFVPPPPAEMQQALSELEQYLHASEVDHPPLIRLALIHYQFEAIHPFLDGNGRIGRLLISLLLIDWGLLPLPLLYLSAYFERRRQQYYELLLAVSERGAWREWLLFFLRGVTEQAQDASIKAKGLQDLHEDWRKRLAVLGRSNLPLRLTDHLFARPVITIPQAQQVLKVTYLSAQRAIERLVEAGVLTQLGESSYGRTYVAGEILSIIGEG